MSKPLRPKRGTTAKNDVFVGLASEITIDTQKHSIRVHDGVTAGGHEILPKAINDNLYASKSIDVGVTSFNGSKGAVTYTAPVVSVNGQTGAVNVPTGHNVGEEWVSYLGKIPAGGVPYCGQTVSRSVYADLWAYAQAQGLVKTESEWQSWASSHGGNVPYYSSGNGSTTFRMPSIKGYIKGASSQSESGSYVAEGLPNISGRAGCQYVGRSHDRVEEGALFTSDYLKGAQGNDGTTGTAINIDASRSSSIYGNSDHVTPETSVVMFGVYAFGEITNTGSLDAYTLATGLARVESNMVDKTSAHITETWSSGTSWYRKYSDGWIEQGGVAQGVSGTITLYVKMKDTNYSIIANVKNSNNNSSGFTFQPRTPTTTTIPYYCTYVTPSTSGGSSEQYYWEVKGYSA